MRLKQECHEVVRFASSGRESIGINWKQCEIEDEGDLLKSREIYRSCGVLGRMAVISLAVGMMFAGCVDKTNIDNSNSNPPIANNDIIEKTELQSLQETVLTLDVAAAAQNEQKIYECGIDSIIEILKEYPSDHFPSKIMISNQISLSEDDLILLDKLEAELGVVAKVKEFVIPIEVNRINLSGETYNSRKAQKALSAVFVDDEIISVLPDRLLIAPFSELTSSSSHYQSGAGLEGLVSEKHPDLPTDQPFVFHTTFIDESKFDNFNGQEFSESYTVFYSYNLKRIVHGQCYLDGLGANELNLENCVIHIFGYPLSKLEVFKDNKSKPNHNNTLLGCNFLPMKRR